MHGSFQLMILIACEFEKILRKEIVPSILVEIIECGYFFRRIVSLRIPNSEPAGFQVAGNKYFRSFICCFFVSFFFVRIGIRETHYFSSLFGQKQNIYLQRTYIKEVHILQYISEYVKTR